MKGRIAASTVSMVMRVEPVQPQAATAQPAQARASVSLPPLPQRRAQATIETHGEVPGAAGGGGGDAGPKQATPPVPARAPARRSRPLPPRAAPNDEEGTPTSAG